MPSSYTSSLRLTLPVTGELTGAWGDTVNDGITALVDSSIAGTATVSHDDSANYVLTFASGSADQARQMVLNVTGTLTEARNVVCPSLSKLYLFKNATTGGFPAVLKTSGGTGIAVPAGAIAFLYCDGTNVVDANTYISTLGVSTLAVADLSAAISSLGAAGAASLTLTTDLPVSEGGTGASSFTSGGLLRGNDAGAISVASAADIVAAIDTTAVTNATNLVTAAFSVVESGGKLYFKYGATDIASLDSSGNFTTLANVTAYGTP